MRDINSVLLLLLLLLLLFGGGIYFFAIFLPRKKYRVVNEGVGTPFFRIILISKYYYGSTWVVVSFFFENPHKPGFAACGYYHES